MLLLRRATLVKAHTTTQVIAFSVSARLISARSSCSASRAWVATQCSASYQQRTSFAGRLPSLRISPSRQHPQQQQQQQQRGARAMASASRKLELEVVDIENPKEYNFILGHAHFIKTVEDIYEALVQSSTALKFGIAFNEASLGYEAMPGRKVRFDGNSEELIELAKVNAMALGAGHTFIVFLDGGFPVNCLNAVKSVTEVCRIHCATSNPTSVVLGKTSDEAVGILGVIDGVRPLEFENDDDKKKRHEFLRMIGYKR
ncbi:hypothetical protein OEZ85_007572 [Tetradesmus obliquus]|uniref:Adenosine monophosphate-protein transferase n=1 Tax=Tetradesmus obliquus TaxID=3088 RepID=A0ABY8TGB2_TETOB|nr:hypothetical protein OEZ85_007572 [Tetradesmus obliquus]